MYPFQQPEDAKLSPPEQLQVMFPRIVSAKFPQPAWMGKDCLDLLRGMMEADPQKRLSAEGVMQHPWFLHGQRLPAPSCSCPELLLANARTRGCLWNGQGLPAAISLRPAGCSPETV